MILECDLVVIFEISLTIFPKSLRNRFFPRSGVISWSELLQNHIQITTFPGVERFRCVFRSDFGVIHRSAFFGVVFGVERFRRDSLE